MGVVSGDDIYEALRRQVTGHLNSRLGEILVSAGHLTRADLEHALKAQRMLRSGNRRIRALGAAMLSELSTRSLDALADEGAALSQAGVRAR